MMALRRDVARLGNALSIRDLKTTMDRCKTVAQMQQLHDRWTVKMNRLTEQCQMMEKFPTPPIPGNVNVVPILNRAELNKEGRTMKHCVAGYADSVLEGKSYIYQVMVPERATLELRRIGHRWRINELKLESNQNPSLATREAVRHWFREFADWDDDDKNIDHSADEFAVLDGRARIFAGGAEDDLQVPTFLRRPA